MKKVRLKEGLHYGIPADVYHADPCPRASLNFSVAKILVFQSPLHAWYQHPRLNKKFVASNNEKFDIGSAAHALILEKTEDAIEVIDAKDYRSNGAREMRDAALAKGKIPVLASHMPDLKKMAEAFFEGVKKCDELENIFEHGNPEVTAVWREGKVWMRGRFDWLAEDHTMIIDYKTSEHADVNSFVRAIASHAYDLQAALYLRGLHALDKNSDAKFTWIVQEVKDPYAVSFIGYGGRMAEVASRKADLAIKIWSECMRRKNWPGYASQIAWPELPPWSELQFSEIEVNYSE